MLATRTNTAIGVGQLSTFRFGVDPNPPVPSESNSLPLGATGQWLDTRSGEDLRIVLSRLIEIETGVASTLRM